MNKLDTKLDFDPNIVLKRVDGDRELLREVASLFFEDTPRLLSDIRNAILCGDSKALERSAHTLKGSIANFGLEVASEAAYGLEQMGRNGDFAHTQDILTRLEQQVALLGPALESILDQKAP